MPPSPYDFNVIRTEFQFEIDQFVPSERELKISRKSTKLSANDVWLRSAQVSISNQIANTHSINCSFHVTLGQVKWKCLAKMMGHFNGMGREFHVYRQNLLTAVLLENTSYTNGSERY